MLKSKGGDGIQKEFCWDGDLYFDHYEGDVVNGMREGNGQFTFTDGSFYAGQWKSNKPCGLGLFRYADGKYDVGMYQNGFLNGYGRAQYSNGDVYEGYFKAGDMSGLGLYYQIATKAAVFGIFGANKLVEPINRLENVVAPDLLFSILSRFSPSPVGKLERTYVESLAIDRKETPTKSGEPEQKDTEGRGDQTQKAQPAPDDAPTEKKSKVQFREEGEADEPAEDERLHTIHDSVSVTSKKLQT